MKIHNQIFGLLLGALLLVSPQACRDTSSSNHASLFPGRKKADHLDRFETEIQMFELADKKKMPPAKAVLFLGSSSIRMWETLEKDFACHQVINRGFGGSTIPEVLYYADRIVWKYKPKVIVFYCGENDLNDGVPPVVVFQNFKKFIGETEKNLPGAQLVFISAKPSPARWKLWKDFQLFNTMVFQFSESRPAVHFLDISPFMLTSSNQPDTSLFIADQLHMNQKGFNLWTYALKPMLVKIAYPR